MRLDGREEQLELIREIANSLSDPVFLVDKARNVWYHNRAFEALVGIRLSSKRYKGSPCNKLLGLEICDENCVMRKAVESQQDIRLAEIAGTTANGEQHNFHITALPVINSAGSAFGALIFMRDITAETQIHRKYKDLVSRNASISLSGVVEGGNLIDILQLFVFLQKTGRLRLQRGNEQGDLIFSAGKVLEITYGVAKGEKALGRLMAWQDATFSFEPTETVVAQPMTKSTDFLLMDAVREIDELSVRAHELPTLETRPSVMRIVDRTTEEIEDVPWQVYEIGLQGQTVSEMLDGIDITDTRVYFALLALKDKGILVW